MQEMADADVVDTYGRQEPTFGGVYFDGDVLVALFTNDLETHRARLVPLLRAPDQFRVAGTNRTYAEVEAANMRVQQRLMSSSGRPHQEVVGVGISKQNGQFVVGVTVEDLSDQLAAVITATVAPDDVVVQSGTRARRL